jgi:hypothetical protein
MSILPNSAELADRFGSIAQDFCSVVDSAPGLDRTELLLQIYRKLPRLIGEAIILPEVEISDDQSPEGEKRWSLARARVQMSDKQWRELYDSLGEKLGDWDLYLQVFDPTSDKEAIQASLADDIADIYRDLKYGLVINDAQQALPEESIWHWRLLFYSHWGEHAMDALRTIHSLVRRTLE